LEKERRIEPEESSIARISSIEILPAVKSSKTRRLCSVSSGSAITEPPEGHSLNRVSLFSNHQLRSFQKLFDKNPRLSSFREYIDSWTGEVLQRRQEKYLRKWLTFRPVTSLCQSIKRGCREITADDGNMWIHIHGKGAILRMMMPKVMELSNTAETQEISMVALFNSRFPCGSVPWGPRRQNKVDELLTLINRFFIIRRAQFRPELFTGPSPFNITAQIELSYSQAKCHIWQDHARSWHAPCFERLSIGAVLTIWAMATGSQFSLIFRTSNQKSPIIMLSLKTRWMQSLDHEHDR